MHFRDEGEREDFIWNLVRLEALYASIEPSNISQLGIPKNEFIVDCQFGNFDCSQVGYFKLFSTPEYYNCYTFSITKTFTNMVNPGAQNGLSIILKSNNPTFWLYDASNKVGNVNGVKVVLHEKGTLPPIHQMGFDIQPGFSTNVALIMRQHSRLNSPYEKCFDRHNERHYFGSAFIYSQELCEDIKKAHEIHLRCKCKSPRYISYHHSNVTYCANLKTYNLSTIRENILCQMYTEQTFGQKAFENCIWPCEQTDYNIMLSQTEWPQDIMIRDFIDNPR